MCKIFTSVLCHAKISGFNLIDPLMELCESLDRLNLQGDAYHNLQLTSEGIQGALQLAAAEYIDKEGNQSLATKACRW